MEWVMELMPQAEHERQINELRRARQRQLNAAEDYRECSDMAAHTAC
jgi:hypothetical protein